MEQIIASESKTSPKAVLHRSNKVRQPVAAEIRSIETMCDFKTVIQRAQCDCRQPDLSWRVLGTFESQHRRRARENTLKAMVRQIDPAQTPQLSDVGVLTSNLGETSGAVGFHVANTIGAGAKELHTTMARVATEVKIGSIERSSKKCRSTLSISKTKPLIFGFTGMILLSAR